MLVGKAPFATNNPSDLLQRILQADFSLPEDMNPDAKDLILKLIQIKPAARLSADEALQHRWFQDNLHTSSTESRMAQETLSSVPRSSEFEDIAPIPTLDLSGAHAQKTPCRAPQQDPPLSSAQRMSEFENIPFIPVGSGARALQTPDAPLSSIERVSDFEDIAPIPILSGARALQTQCATPQREKIPLSVDRACESEELPVGQTLRGARALQAPYAPSRDSTVDERVDTSVGCKIDHNSHLENARCTQSAFSPVVSRELASMVRLDEDEEVTLFTSTTTESEKSRWGNLQTGISPLPPRVADVPKIGGLSTLEGVKGMCSLAAEVAQPGWVHLPAHSPSRRRFAPSVIGRRRARLDLRLLFLAKLLSRCRRVSTSAGLCYRSASRPRVGGQAQEGRNRQPRSRSLITLHRGRIRRR